MKTKILVLAANPLDTQQLRLDEEVRAIDQSLRQAKFRDRYELVSHWAVRIEDLQELLLRHQPDIVHFSGHGSGAEEIILQTADGNSAPVSVAALGDLFGLLKDNIRCVVLNACYSELQAKAIAEQIEVVVGMSDAIGDDAARSFAAAFYRALASGRNVKNAFALGCNQIDLAGLDQAKIPQLIARRADPATVVIARRSFGERHARALALAAVLAVAGLALIFFAGLPAAARAANQAGLAALEGSDLSSARAALERAVLLDPGNGRYHYNLGRAYELGQRYNAALAQYQEAQNRAQDFWPAYNSWGSLQLRTGGDPEAAVTVLRAGMSKVQALAKQTGQDATATALGAAVLGKNLGWAYVQQGAGSQALAELQKAAGLLQQLQAEGFDVRYYLAGTYYWLAQAQALVAGPHAVATKLAWAKTEGFARSVVDAGICPEYADLTEFYCADAQVWADEAAGRLGE